MHLIVIGIPDIVSEGIASYSNRYSRVYVRREMHPAVIGIRSHCLPE